MTQSGIRNRKSLGFAGETIACQYLQRLGYQVLARNWRYGRYGELDIVACVIKDDDTNRAMADSGPSSRILVFIEVKTRRSAVCGRALEALDERKQAQLGFLAEAFVAEHPEYQEWIWRFDAVLLDQSRADDGYALEHLINLF